VGHFWRALKHYKEAADIEVNHEDPHGALIGVPDDKGKVTSKPFGECSAEQMRRAIQRLRKPASSKPLPKEAELLAEQYSEAVTGRFAKGTRVKVLVRNQKGKAVLDFKGIPVEQVGQLIEALSGQLPPVRTVQSGRPGKLPAPAPHGSGRAQLAHPALRLMGSLRVVDHLVPCAGRALVSPASLSVGVSLIRL
jgi:hypothetical protein